SVRAVAVEQSPVRVAGDAVVVLQGIGQGGTNGGADFALSSQSSAAATIVRGASDAFSGQPVWIDRDGRVTPVPVPPRAYRQPRLSADGQRGVVDVDGANLNRDVWMFGLRRSL